MMKRLTVLLLLLAMPAAALAQGAQAPAAPAAAQTAPPSPGTKFAVMDFFEVVRESDPGLEAFKEFEKQIAPTREAFDKMEKDFIALQEKLKTATTDAEKSTLTRQIQDKNVELTRAQEDAQKMSDELQAKLLPPIAELVNKAVAAYALENELAVVLDRVSEPTNIVFAGKASDITAEIIRRVNTEWAKNPKAAAAAPAAPATP